MRVLFEKYLERLQGGKSASQGLLFPEMIQFPPSEIVVLESILPELHHIGFDLSDLGGGSYAINGVPSGIEGLNPVDLLRSMVNTAMEKGCDVKEEVQNSLALMLAKSAAVVYGQVLTNDEMSGLIDDLFACSMPNYTPDGKTVLTIISEEEIEQRF